MTGEVRIAYSIFYVNCNALMDKIKIRLENDIIQSDSLIDKFNY